MGREKRSCVVSDGKVLFNFAWDFDIFLVAASVFWVWIKSSGNLFSLVSSGAAFPIGLSWGFPRPFHPRKHNLYSAVASACECGFCYLWSRVDERDEFGWLRSVGRRMPSRGFPDNATLLSAAFFHSLSEESLSYFSEYAVDSHSYLHRNGNKNSNANDQKLFSLLETFFFFLKRNVFTRNWWLVSIYCAKVFLRSFSLFATWTINIIQCSAFTPRIVRWILQHFFLLHSPGSVFIIRSSPENSNASRHQ